MPVFGLNGKEISKLLTLEQNELSSARLQHEGFSDIEDHKLQCYLLREERKKLVSI